MKIASTSIPVPGYFNPTTTLSRKLQSGNYELVCIFSADTVPVVGAANLTFLLYPMESATPRTAGPDQLGLAAEDIQSQGEVTLGRAFQALSARRW